MNRTRAARVLVAALLSLLVVAASAQPRERDRGVPPGISKILKKIQKALGITLHDEQPLPPRP